MTDQTVVAGVPGSRVSELPEIKLIDDIDDLAADYKARHAGREPLHVSHWDPSEEFVAAVSAHVDLPNLSELQTDYDSPVPYTYSYLLKRRPGGLFPVIRKLGFDPSQVSAQIFENGTTSIAAVANWLKVTGVSEVALLRPYYFAAPRNLERLGLQVRQLSMVRRGGEYFLPHDLSIKKGQALWVTNPTYNTSVYTLDKQIGQLKAIADAGGIVIADEALAVPGSTLAAVLGGHPNFVGLYTPHKSVCMNGLKFSAVVYHPSTGDTFDHWSDVLSGGLSLSAVAATQHFIRPEFDAYERAFFSQISDVRIWHDKLASQFKHMHIDAFARGHFISVFFPALEASLGDDVAFLSELMEQTGSAIIPGTRSGFDPSTGFSFRVNLAQDSDSFRETIGTLYASLTARAANRQAA